MSLDERFKKAAHYVSKGPAIPNVETDDKLKFYALFKQATSGDVTGSAPFAVQIEARAKWNAWNEQKGMSKESAMNEYIDKLTSMVSDWEDSDVAKNFQG